MLKQLKLSTRSARLSTQTPLVTNHKAPILYDNHQRHSLDSTLFAKTIDVWIQSTAAKNIGEPIGIMQVSRKIFANVPRIDILTRALRYEESILAQSTASTKQLGQVRGSTRKPFEGKGRGAARVGTLRAPQFRGGYNAHGVRPHKVAIDIQKKLYDSAITYALSQKFSGSQLLFVDSFLSRADRKNANPRESVLDVLAKLDITGRKIWFIYGSTIDNEAYKFIEGCNTFQKIIPRLSDLGPPGSRADIAASLLRMNKTQLSEIKPKDLKSLRGELQDTVPTSLSIQSPTEILQLPENVVRQLRKLRKQNGEKYVPIPVPKVDGKGVFGFNGERESSVMCTHAKFLGVKALLDYDMIVIDKAGVEWLEDRYLRD